MAWSVRTRSSIEPFSKSAATSMTGMEPMVISRGQVAGFYWVWRIRF
jgi:hypothetical protein